MAVYENADAAARLMAVEDSDESLDNMNPIFGVDEAPDLSFKDAMQKANVRRGKRKRKKRKREKLLTVNPPTATCSHHPFAPEMQRAIPSVITRTFVPSLCCPNEFF